MALKLPDSAVPMGDFPVAKAVDIDFEDGENLQEKLDNGTLGGGGNTTDLTDLENRVTTNEADITDLQEQTSDLQKQIDNLDIPDLTEVNTKLTQLETKANLIPVIVDNPTEYDLNNYKENGNYSIGNSPKYSNVPIDQPGLLTVIRSNTYRLQIYTMVNKDDVYFRKSTDWGKTWSSWVLLNGKVDLSSINAKLTQLENTINEVGGGGIYQSGEIEVGKWTGGQKLYRYTISDNTEQNISNTGILRNDFFTLSRDKYVVVKLDGTFRMCAASDNSGAHTVYALPYVDLETNRQVHLVYTTMDKVRLSGINLTNYKILGFDISIYYYKK